MAASTSTFSGIDFARIPAGEFVMGSAEDDPLSWGDEHPRHLVRLDYDFWICRTPVTNAHFARFVAATGYGSTAETEGWAFVFDPSDEEWKRVEGSDWRHPTGPESDADRLPDHPVVCVSWHDARAYCTWIDAECGTSSGLRFRLPTEAEWEKAARGADGRIYPWGDRFEPGLCNHIGSAARATVAVDSLPPASLSPYGVAGMSGNTWDWTTTLWGPDRDKARFAYPYDAGDGREDLAAGGDWFRIVRGGSFKNEPQACRSACRDLDPPGWSLNNLGFRLAATAST